MDDPLLTDNCGFVGFHVCLHSTRGDYILVYILKVELICFDTLCSFKTADRIYDMDRLKLYLFEPFAYIYDTIIEDMIIGKGILANAPIKYRNSLLGYVSLN